MDLDLAQVRAFVAVADHGHFGRAARTLHLSQQALSKRVRRLERQLGPLLERHATGVSLTAPGERFLPAARQLLDVADHAVVDMAQAPAAPLRIDVWSDMQSPAQLLRAIAREQPELVVQLSMRRNLADAVGAVQRHELDVAFGNVDGLAEPLPAGFSAELVLTDTIVALVSKHSPLAGRDKITGSDLARNGIWWPMSGSSPELRSFAEAYARAIGAVLVSDGTNVGLDAFLGRVHSDPTLVAPVVSTWPIPAESDLRLIPLDPVPHYPWHAVWRTANAHPSMRPLLAALRRQRKHHPTA